MNVIVNNSNQSPDKQINFDEQILPEIFNSLSINDEINIAIQESNDNESLTNNFIKPRKQKKGKILNHPLGYPLVVNENTLQELTKLKEGFYNFLTLSKEKDKYAKFLNKSCWKEEDYVCFIQLKLSLCLRHELKKKKKQFETKLGYIENILMIANNLQTNSNINEVVKKSEAESIQNEPRRLEMEYKNSENQKVK